MGSSSCGLHASLALLGAETASELYPALRECDIFIALLTRAFSESDWTDQETGFALALGKTIIPVKLHRDENPHGFIDHIQALKWNKESSYASAWDVAACIGKNEKFRAFFPEITYFY